MIKPNRHTITYLNSNIKGYVNKLIGIDKFQEEIKKKYKLDKIMRFDLGENSDGPPIKVLEELENIKKNPGSISEYPDSNYFRLKNRLASFYGIDIDNIAVGAGSSELIRNISKCWLDKGNCAIYPIPSFYVIENSILEFGGIPIYIRLKEEENFQWTENTTNELIKVSAYARPKLTWLVTPNNPTGGTIPLYDILKIIKNDQNSIVIVDEVFGEYISNEASAINIFREFENVLILRTFSKAYGMAGLRLGYCIGSKELIKTLEQIRMEFPITSISEKLGIIALEDKDYLENTRKKLLKRKNSIYNALKNSNIKYIPSDTNIMLIKHEFKNLYTELMKKGILTTIMDTDGLKGKGYVRITIKNDEENNLLIKSLCELNDDILNIKLEENS